jgi:predicted nucleotidyltransferase
MYYEEVVRQFTKYKVKYLLVGGLAVNLHGVPRFTADMDILVDLADRKNSISLFRALKEIGYLPKVPVTAEQFSRAINRRNWMEHKNMVVFSFVNLKNPLYIIDVFIHNPINFRQAYKRRMVENGDDGEINVISCADLIKLKKLAGRAQDIADIESLNKIGRRNESAKRKTGV